MKSLTKKRTLLVLSLLSTIVISCGSNNSKSAANNSPSSANDNISFPITVSFTYGKYHGENMTIEFSSRDEIISAKNYCYTTFDASSLTDDYMYLNGTATAQALSGTGWTSYLLNMRSSINGSRTQTWICVNWGKRWITNAEPADVCSADRGEKNITVYQF